MIEEFSHAIVPLADGWFQLDVRRGTEILFSGRLSDRDHAERVAARYLSLARGKNPTPARKFNEDMRLSKPCRGRPA